MTVTVAAIYENGVLRLLSPLPLAEGTRVKIIVKESVAQEKLGSAVSDRTGAELARLWEDGPHLSEEDAAAFERDLASARESLEGSAPSEP
jgi:predicted DNA-binding antitoxin AbrB/MazE fold protein